ncbi:thiol-disulfide oxidoreductase DCC family protein [Rouxiella chamberiensis]|uniref:Thiol-disulfide oxidoreductase DCC family protein n=1 Tax=Rouxiella chamberiensis TaxID=1513468 RepID=A0ABY7HPL0_9GAMM|nr:thiol-disulfide oxidoreductase DCC family protein [Rouxiella chamberiensis]WAT01326.1 thiol-disulfide oxidoreductase DCC family protein [Rouxiella chamberiensis]
MSEPTQNTSPPPYLHAGEKAVIYDGVCKLCNGWVNFLIRHDRQHKVRLAPVQSEAGKALSLWAGMSPENVNTIVLIDDKGIYKRSDAIFRVMSFLPQPWRAVSVLHVFPRRFRDGCYNLIALNRYKIFGKYDSVKTLQADHSQRFIE